MKRAFSLLVVPVAALTLTACGSGNNKDHAMSGHSMAGHSMGTSSAPASHNAQDVMFAQMMIPHHQQAVVMAKQAATKASSPQVKTLAGQIEQAQAPEIQKMTGWLKTWGASQPSESSMHMGDGMMSAQDMKNLGNLSGKPFDKAFLQMMTKHHQGAITMAKTEQAQGSSADAKALASSIVTSQSAEITEMQKLLN
ncbi:MAG: lipoprotein [Actinoallomurus sp.]|jgi:uncharacterized protein (DUF305 family)|nr:lipoprotein [Actinoallomurus sp.]